MLPVKDILARKIMIPGPPIIVIDEANIEITNDAGPVCGCEEKYDMVQNYKPFLPGGVHPYKRRQIPDDNCFEVAWRNVKVGSMDLVFERPVATHKCELAENREIKGKSKGNDDDFMMLTQPRYTEAYFQQKLRQHPREHSEGCNCPNQ